MMKVHVLEVLMEATQMSAEDLDQLMREKKDDVVVSLQKENICIAGEEKVVRRVFVRTSSALEYATVGWVMNDDIDQCMTCSKDFWFFHTRKHCHACGNINCSDCAEAFCLVEELPDQTHGVPVCTQCYWGQDIVSAWHRMGVDDDLQAATSRWTDTTLRNTAAHHHDNDTFSDNESEDSFQQEDHRDYDSDSTSESVIEARLKEESRLKHEELLFEKEAARKADRLADQEHRSKTNKVHFGSQDNLISDIEYVSMEDTDATHVLPEPLFVMKTTRTRSTKKVYINVCTLRDVDMGMEFGCASGLHLNGTPLEGTDRYTGDPITTFDVLVNTCPTTSSGMWFDTTHMTDWTEEVCMQVIELINTQCYENIDESMPSIPKKKYKGNVVKPFDIAAASTKFHMENTIRLHEASAQQAREMQAQKDREEQQRVEDDARMAIEKKQREEQDRTREEISLANEARDRAEQQKVEEERIATAAREQQERDRARREAELTAAEAARVADETRLRVEQEQARAREQELARDQETARLADEKRVEDESKDQLLHDSPSLPAAPAAVGAQMPSPLFVIKTKSVSTNEKVFVNVCTLREVDLVTALAAKRGLVLNGTLPVDSVDKSGDTCHTYDALINTVSTSEKCFDMNRVDEWREEVGGQLVALINQDCSETLDDVLKFPKIKGNYKGEAVKPYEVHAALGAATSTAAATTTVRVSEQTLSQSSPESPVGDLRKLYSRTHGQSRDAVRKNDPSSSPSDDQRSKTLLPTDEELYNEYITTDDLAFLSMQTISPLFVIKTKSVSTNEKVFVNVCTLREVDLVTALAAKRGLVLNGTLPVDSVDKSGDTCHTYDAFINTVSTSEKCFDMERVDEWREEVGGQLVALINQDCSETLDDVLKFPKIKGNYKGEVIKPFTASGGRGGLSTGSTHADKEDQVACQLKKGWLKKQSRGGFIKNWKSRFFVLSGGDLRYFEEEKETAPFGSLEKGRMGLVGADVKDSGGLKFCLTVSVGNEKDLLLEAEDDVSKKEWMKALKQHIETL